MDREAYFKVGEYVYPHCTPVRAAKVIATHSMGEYPVQKNGKPGGTRPYELTIMNLDGRVERVCELGYRSFAGLIESHRKKLATHEKTLAKLEALPTPVVPTQKTVTGPDGTVYMLTGVGYDLA